MWTHPNFEMCQKPTVFSGAVLVSIYDGQGHICRCKSEELIPMLGF